MTKRASELYKRYTNPNGAAISTVSRRILEQDGLRFKDIDGTGTVSKVNDWRLSPKERADAYVKLLTAEEKIGQLFISDWRMAKYPAPRMGDHVMQPDESGILDEAELHTRNIFGEQHLPGTSTLIKEWFARHIIIRTDPTGKDMADYMNQLQALAEECEHYVPVEAASNSRNEHAEAVFGMSDASGAFATWPGTLGIAAAVRGTGDLGIIDRFADCIRREWNASGLRKGYMYMADVVTDPRWQRTYGTFGEDAQLTAKIFDRLVPGIQGQDYGVAKDGVALTVKHFPGGGPRENGFDPHYAAGQWNVYATENSLREHHLPAFIPAIRHGTSSIMPYYSKPSAEKSAPQTDLEGNPIRLDPYGFAYNKVFIQGLLRDTLGFTGYINSDSGILHNMCWGVDMLDVPERIGFAVTQSGVDLLSGQFDMEAGKESYARGKNGWYESHPVPEGFRSEDLVLTDEALDRAVSRTLAELFALGAFDNPYRDADEADRVMADAADRAEAALIHRKSVVLLKGVPVSPEGKTVYAESFAKDPNAASRATEKLRRLLDGCTLTDDPAQADLAILSVDPSSGAYFSATKGYLELDICENKTVHDVDDAGRPVASTHTETTLTGAARIAEIAQAVHARGGRVLANVNVKLAWQLGNLEPYADTLTAGFDTETDAVLDVLLGRFAPVGRLPLTLPKNDAVLAVNADGVCISPNDIPGTLKDKYLPDSLKDENGKAYAYRDAAGNYYEAGFGL